MRATRRGLRPTFLCVLACKLGTWWHGRRFRAGKTPSVNCPCLGSRLFWRYAER